LRPHRGPVLPHPRPGAKRSPSGVCTTSFSRPSGRSDPGTGGAVVRDLAEAQQRARTAPAKGAARNMRRRGHLLLRGSKTLKAELKRLQKIRASFAR